MNLVQMFFFCMSVSFFGHGFMADLKADQRTRDVAISLGLVSIGVNIALLFRIEGLSAEDCFSLSAAVAVLWSAGILGLMRTIATGKPKVDMTSVHSESGAPVRVPLLEKGNTNVTAG
jgi:hypothetical protein